jgi:hypothetical protein
MDETFAYQPPNRLTLVVGNYGSGKTEVAVNLAIRLAADHPVTIVDLDLVNPYFRCRESREEMEGKGIRVVYPRGEYHSADLPIVLPEVKGAICAEDGYTILDVGGDDVGARVLSSIAEAIAPRPYSMLQVINSRRPFTGDVEGCLRIREEIEAASRLKITGLISNSHLLEETAADTIREGIALAAEVAERAGIGVEFATLDRGLLAEFEDGELPCPVLPLERRMLRPWELEKKADHADWIRRQSERGE